MTLLVLLALVLVGVWLALVGSVWRSQDRIVFRPPRVDAVDMDARKVEYATADGTTGFAYLIGEPQPDRPLVLAFHGNADLARWFVPWGRELAARLYAAVLIPEYRGYDALPGTPTCAGVALDARGAADWARECVGERGQLVYFGHSLGAAIAAELAASLPPVALVLQSPFTSAREMARRMFVPGLTTFWPWMSRVPYDNVARVRELDAPVWVAHGERDFVVPAHMGREVFAAAKHPGRLLIVPDAAHNDVDELGGGEYWAWLTDACAVGGVFDQNVTVSPRDGAETR